MLPITIIVKKQTSNFGWSCKFRKIELNQKLIIEYKISSENNTASIVFSDVYIKLSFFKSVNCLPRTAQPTTLPT
ncbi:MAG: hypothetical protein CMP52_03570 [Flavobacteriales bacterium]|nr:hypothetical protein [Candidatus Arcticimaribacter sp.]